MTTMEPVDIDRNYIPRFVIEANFGPDRPVIVDRLTEVRTPIPGPQHPADIVATMVRLGITVIEIDPAGNGLVLLQPLQEWGGITIVSRRKSAPVLR